MDESGHIVHHSNEHFVQRKMALSPRELTLALIEYGHIPLKSATARKIRPTPIEQDPFLRDFVEGLNIITSRRQALDGDVTPVSAEDDWD